VRGAELVKLDEKASVLIVAGLEHLTITTSKLFTFFSFHQSFQHADSFLIVFRLGHHWEDGLYSKRQYRDDEAMHIDPFAEPGFQEFACPFSFFPGEFFLSFV
jgi:hypothetical protein